MDYTSTPITATFTAGTTNTTINVPVTRDSIVESSRESFDLTFTIPSSLSHVVPGDFPMAFGEIIDGTGKYLIMFINCFDINSLYSYSIL